MWVKTQSDRSIININNAFCVDVEFIGRTGRIYALFQNLSDPVLLGEYRSQVAKAVFDILITSNIADNGLMIMPSEKSAEKMYCF